MYSFFKNSSCLSSQELITMISDLKFLIGKMSNNPATGIPDISSMNLANPYMEEIPDLFGFEDIVYT